MALEDPTNSLSFDPFITRKQIPRTPENLRKLETDCVIPTAEECDQFINFVCVTEDNYFTEAATLTGLPSNTTQWA